MSKGLLTLLMLMLVITVAYAAIAVRAGNTIYNALDIYALLSVSPLEGVLGSLALIMSLLTAVLVSVSSRGSPNDKRLGLIVAVVSIGFVLSVRFLIPDLAMRYYITDFEDSYNHMYRAIYIAVHGHLTPYWDFMWLNRSLWMTLAEAMLALWGHPGSIRSPPFYFVIKWWPELMTIMMAPAVYALARSLGLSRWASAAAVALSIALWPEFPVTASDHYGTVTFTIALAFFVLALRERDRRSLLLVAIASLALVYTHELIAALAAVAFIGGSFMLVLFPGRLQRRSALWPLAPFTAAYLIMGLYNSVNFTQQGISFYWHVIINTLEKLLKKAPSVISSAAYRPLPAYHIAVELKAATYIAELLIPFAVLLALSVRDARWRPLFGALGLAGLVGAALTLGLGAVGWADRVPVMMVGLAGVAIAGLLEVRRHRRAAIAGAILTMFILTPLAFYASFAGYPGETFFDTSYHLEVSGFETSMAALGFGYGGISVPCANSTSATTYPSGAYEVYWPYIDYAIYSQCPYPGYVYSYIGPLANVSSVIVDAPPGFIGQTG